MNSKFGHIEFKVAQANLSFYGDLLTFLGWKTFVANDEMGGYGDSAGGSLWFLPGPKDVANDYDGPGVNHVAISVEAQSDVDEAVRYLQDRGVTTLFETPRHRPEFVSREGETYYQVMFESPDRVLFEIVYTGPKS